MIKYFIEQINVSDSEYKIIELNSCVNLIKAGDMIFSYESSKASYEVIAEQESKLYINPKIQVGELYKVGTLVALSSKDEIAHSDLTAIFNLESFDNDSRRKENDIIVTKKAQALIDEFGIDLSLIDSKSIITEELLLEYLNLEQDTKFQNLSFYHSKENLNYFTNNRKRLAVIGAGKAALQLFDSVLIGNSHEIILFYEENQKYSDKLLMGLPIKVFSDLNQIVDDFNQQVFDEIIISFSGDIKKRKKIFDYLVSQKIPFTNVIHPSVIIGNNSKIGIGNLIFANSRLGPFSVLGDNNVISSYCSIEHHNYVGSHNTFGPSVCFSGTCKIGNENKFGTGIYIEPNVCIGSCSIISSGISLTRNVPDNTLVKNLNKIEFKSL
jgi:acetyltransferase-like isoleucine patch superfamily enzyme